MAGITAENRLTTPAAYRMNLSANNPILSVVPSARIPEGPGAVVPHTGICEGASGNRGPYLNRFYALPVNRRKASND
jgi:hypothetical protein